MKFLKYKNLKFKKHVLNVTKRKCDIYKKRNLKNVLHSRSIRLCPYAVSSPKRSKEESTAAVLN